jgi:hypothetical protein
MGPCFCRTRTRGSSQPWVIEESEPVLVTHVRGGLQVKIHLKIEGLPQLYKILNKKKALDFEFQGQTIRDFAVGLARKYGRGVDRVLLDQNGAIDMGLRVAVNFSVQSYENRMDTALHDGDTIHLMTVG